jgi:metal-dependent amidase/aminoacylase/carboxypeptidase family protein
MAFSDKFSIDVKGVGGHGAHPQGTVDAVVEAAALVTALQTVVSRNKVPCPRSPSPAADPLQDPLQSGVLTCGTINGGYAPNIIADHVKISGTTRAFSTDVQVPAPALLTGSHLRRI